jgi:hypothetical protein
MTIPDIVFYMAVGAFFGGALGIAVNLMMGDF